MTTELKTSNDPRLSYHVNIPLSLLIHFYEEEVITPSGPLIFTKSNGSTPSKEECLAELKSMMRNGLDTLPTCNNTNRLGRCLGHLDGNQKTKTCSFCNHHWVPRIEDPERCPKCKRWLKTGLHTRKKPA